MQTEKVKINEERFKKLKEAFAYFEEYDKLGGRPDRRVPLCVTMPLRLKRRLEKEKNISRFVEKAIEKAIN